MPTPSLVSAPPGQIHPGGLELHSLVSAMLETLEGQILLSGDYLSRPEHRLERDMLANVVGMAQDGFSDDGRAWRGVDSGELVAQLCKALSLFAPSGHYFGVQSVNGSPWGFWPALDRVG